MKWTTEPPTEPGFYWVKEYRDSVPNIVLTYDTGEESLKCEDGQYVLLMDTAKWAGPIQEPEE